MQVNDSEMTGKSQSEAVFLLRNIPQGSEVSLILSRQIDSDEAESSNQNKVSLFTIQILRLSYVE